MEPIIRQLTESDLEQLKQRTIGKIELFVQNGNKENPGFKTVPRKYALSPLRIPAKFWEFRFVCMSCGKVENMAPYAIAQNTMGHEVIYTCDCGHKTSLPQR